MVSAIAPAKCDPVPTHVVLESSPGLMQQRCCIRAVASAGLDRRQQWQPEQEVI
jgi:hypothetical protein